MKNKKQSSAKVRLLKRIIPYSCVVSIVGVLTYISWLQFDSIHGEPSPSQVSLHRLLAIRDTLAIYAVDHEGKLPDKLEDLVPDYLLSTGTLICPRTSKKTKRSEIEGEPYEYLVPGKIWDELKDSDILVKEPLSVKDAYVIRKDGFHFPELENQ